MYGSRPRPAHDDRDAAVAKLRPTGAAAPWAAVTMLTLAAACGSAAPPLAPPRAAGAEVMAQPPESPPPWISALDRDHPLVGRIYRVADGKWIDERALVAVFAEADYVLLGERHDNPDHHALQAWLIERLIAADRHPALAVEMAGQDQQEALDQAVADHPHDPDAVGDAVQWRQHWPAWAQYRSVVSMALDHRLPIVAANLPQGMVRNLVREGIGAVDAATVARLGLDEEIEPATRSAIQQEMVASHCNMLPVDVADAMVLGQVATDAQLAARLTEHPTAVLIAGSGHVRGDRGVPMHLRRHGHLRKVVSHAFIDVQAGLPSPSDYADRYGVATLPFDYVWFTPRFSDEDPCAGFQAPSHPAPDPS